MSKRCCLWSDGTPQRKTCVKEGAAAGEADRKAVYVDMALESYTVMPRLTTFHAMSDRMYVPYGKPFEHTRALLFSGARSLQLSPTPTVSPSPLARRGTARGQMRIGSRGELLRSPGSAAEPPSSPACTLCERPLQASDSCVRCEKVVCMQCQRRCSLCLRTHCFICCQPNYNERYERMTCIDCLAE